MPIDLLKLSITETFGLAFYIHPLLLLVVSLAILVLAGIYWRKIKALKSFQIVEANFNIGKQFSIKMKPNLDDMQMAYKLWVELNTRKIGLEIDEKNDLIVEIYNSWYEFFKLTRELIKTIPIDKVKANKSTQKLVELSVEVLNEGLRPHLTKWQAKFRRWYNDALQEGNNKQLTPQDIQKQFSEYEKLLQELKAVNKGLIDYKNTLKQIYLAKKFN